MPNEKVWVCVDASFVRLPRRARSEVGKTQVVCKVGWNGRRVEAVVKTLPLFFDSDCAKLAKKDSFDFRCLLLRRHTFLLMYAPVR